MNISSFAYPNKSFYVSRLSKPSVYFGDRLVEAQDRMQPDVKIDELTNEQPVSVYDRSNRILRSKALLPRAFKESNLKITYALLGLGKDFLLRRDLTSAWTNLAIADIHWANNQLADDKSDEMNKKAFEKLKKSIDYLEDVRYAETVSEIDPVVIHGYANRGAYTFYNDIYKESAKELRRLLGEGFMKTQDECFDGMALQFKSDNPNMLKLNFENVKKELPFLEKAISLTERMEFKHSEDRLGAKAEYLTLFGEIQHGLAHFEGWISERAEQSTLQKAQQARVEHSQKARQAFKEAIPLFESLSNKSPLQKELLRQIKEEKAPHLCENGQHVPHTSNNLEVCQALSTLGSRHNNKNIHQFVLSRRRNVFG